MTAIYLNTSWLAGIFFASVLPFPRETILLMGGAGSVLLWYWRRAPIVTTIVCLAALMAGVGRYDLALSVTNANELASAAQEGTVFLRGVISGEPELRDRTTNLVVSVSEVLEGDEWTSVNERVAVSIPRYVDVAYGERLELKGKLQEPQNIGTFDYKAYLARQGIHYQMRFPSIVERQKPAEDDLLAVLYSFKRSIARTLENALPEPQAALAKGILLGIRTGLPDELKSAFSRTNTTHLLAISGWNITIIAGLLRVMGSRLLGRKGQMLFVICGIAFYTALIGPQASVLRAAIMGSMLVIGGHFGRLSDTVVGVLYAAAVMTLFDPFYLWDVGFQLSFASTLGIALLVPQIQRSLAFLPSWLLDIVSVTLAAQLATLPIIAVVFGDISTITVIANALVLPATLPIMILVALTALSGLFWLPLAEVIGFVAWPFLTYMIRVLEYLSSMEWASLSIGNLTPFLALPYYSLIALLLVGRDGSSQEGPAESQSSVSLGTKLTLSILATGAVLAWTAFFLASDAKLRVSFLDVGQGDAIFVETPTGHRILIDGGPSPTKLLNALGRRMHFWDRSIDLMILTHHNDDHMTGLIEALERFDVKRVLEPKSSLQSLSYRRWREVIERKQIVTVEAVAGQEIDVEKGVVLRVFHPKEGGVENDPNKSSVVIKLIAEEVGVLFTGDVDRESQRDIVHSGFDLASQILKVPHHGAAGSLNEAFLSTVKPSVAVISVGAENQFGHPAPLTLEQLKDIRVLRTDLDGTIEVTITDGKYEVRVGH